MIAQMTITELRELFSIDELAHAMANPVSCHFCGAPGTDIKLESDHLFFMHCNNCNAHGPQGTHPLQAALLWNFRNGFPIEEKTL